MAAPQAPAERLRAAGAAFIIDPHVRFKAQVGEPATMFLLDPCGNALEFKAFADPAQLFAKWPAGHARERSPPEPAGNTKKKPAGAGGLMEVLMKGRRWDRCGPAVCSLSGCPVRHVREPVLV